MPLPRQLPTRCLNQDARRSNSPIISDLPGISTRHLPLAKVSALEPSILGFTFLSSCTMMARRPYKTTDLSLDLGWREAFGGSRAVYHPVHQTRGYVVHRTSSSQPVRLTGEFSCDYRSSAYHVVPQVTLYSSRPGLFSNSVIS